MRRRGGFSSERRAGQASDGKVGVERWWDIDDGNDEDNDDADYDGVDKTKYG